MQDAGLSAILHGQQHDALEFLLVFLSLRIDSILNNTTIRQLLIEIIQ